MNSSLLIRCFSWVDRGAVCLYFAFFLLTLLAVGHAKMEKNFFQQRASILIETRDKGKFAAISDSRQAEALKLMDAVHQFMGEGNTIVQGARLDRPDGFFYSVKQDKANYANSCGAHANALGRLLLERSFQIRKVGLDKGKLLGIHHVLEVNLNGNWVLMDPSYNLVFRDPAGQLVGIAELSRNWEQYQNQLPVGYSVEYNYQAYHYTNWSRFGWLAPLLRTCLDSNQPGREFSIAPYLMYKDQYLPWIMAMMAGFCLFLHWLFLVSRGQVRLAERKLCIWLSYVWSKPLQLLPLRSR